jgi:hypothetical protein
MPTVRGGVATDNTKYRSLLEKDFDNAQLAYGKPMAMRVAFQPVYLYLAVA